MTDLELENKLTPWIGRQLTIKDTDTNEAFFSGTVLSYDFDNEKINVFLTSGGLSINKSNFQ